MSQNCQITIDGHPATVTEGVMLLDALREQGVPIPTLCHHRSLEPSGACRLCVVEVTHDNWRGWSGLVTSCLYPVEAGLQVFTRSARVAEVRRTLLEMYLARCPDSDLIKDVARGEGIDTTRFAVAPEADLCIQCGLCIRVCQDLGPAAIAALGRGTEKSVGPRPDRVGEDCTGCLACAQVCPTGEIATRHQDREITIWNRAFPVPLCRVQDERCRGCGVCEEVCPIAIPRVVAAQSGTLVATISADRCVGCGICAGACPTGAITQETFDSAHLAGAAVDGGDLRGRTVVFACSRSSFGDQSPNMIAVPCIGRVTVASILEKLAAGANGVLLMCRDQATCPYGAGGDLGYHRSVVAEQLAVLAGLGDGRVACVKPPPGAGGPVRALTAFANSLQRSPLQETLGGVEAVTRGMDRALELTAWLKSRPELTPSLPPSLRDVLEPVRGDGDCLLYLGDLPELDLLLSLLVPDWRLRDVIAEAVEVLQERGLSVHPAMTGEEVARAVRDGRKVKLIVLSRDQWPLIGGELEIVTIAELGNRDAPTSPASEFHNLFKDFMFLVTPKKRLELAAALAVAPTPVICETVSELAQVKLLTRRGSWQEGPDPDPILAFGKAGRTAAGKVAT